jgi:integrase
MNIVMNWATRWRVEGKPLLERNPVYRLPYLDDINQRRSVWTWDRFQAVIEAAERLEMQVQWHCKRERVRCFLTDVLVITQGIGRGIGAVRQLRYSDLRLNEGPHGRVLWRADADKTGKEWIAPISPKYVHACSRSCARGRGWVTPHCSLLKGTSAALWIAIP